MTNQWKTVERYAYLGVAIGLLILAVISSTSYQSLVQIRQDFDWVIQTREVLLNLSYFLASLKDAEMGQRGYLLTGQEQYLEPYQYVEKRVESCFVDLRRLATGYVMQQKKLDVLEGLVTEKLAELQELIILQKDQGTEAAKEAIITGKGGQIMNAIQALVLQMDEDERVLLDQRTKRISRRVKLDALVKGTGIVLILITAILVIVRVNHWLIEREQAEKKQMDIVNMKTDFVSTVSHELRTPLKAVRESIAIVLDGAAGPVTDEQKKFLMVTQRNVDRLAKLINNVLDFQKLDSGRMAFSMSDNNINEAVQEVCELMSASAQKRGLSIVTKLAAHLPKLRFDKDKILQVLTNIVDNAIKFTESGNITITTDVQENAVLVSAQDSGPGISRDDLPKLFNKFVQLSSSNHRISGGTGLGLAICKEIITWHDGRIWAESQVGSGTVVCFTLPIKKRRTCS